MRYFCATHQPLDWPLPSFMEPVATVPAGAGVTDLSERYPELGGRGVELGEYATLFAVRRLLQESWRENGPAAADEMIGTGHYRRFAVTRPTGMRSAMFGVVTPEEFTALPDDLFLPSPGTLLLAAPVDPGVPIVSSYGMAHPVRDLLRFMAAAIDLGAVDDAVVGRFLGQNVMLTTPTAGVVPATWLVETLETIERVVDAFQESYAEPREGYQARAMGFCCERLHALLAVPLIEGWAQDRVVFNPAIIVTGEGEYRPGG